MPVTRFTTKLLGTAGDDSVDQIDGAILAVNDITICACVDDDTLYFYKVDESGDAESSPDVIAPNLNAGNKRHKLLGVSGGGGGGGDTLPIADTTAVVKGSVDATKLVRIEADGLTTGTTRVLTMPDKDLTPAASGANADITSILNAALYLGRDSDNKIDFATDDTLKIKIGGVEKAIVSISAGAGDNDKLVTQGYVDDNAGAKSGYDTIDIPAGAMIPCTTNGAEASTQEYGTNDIDVDVMAFDDGATEERIQFTLVMPENWNRSTIKAKFYWGNASGASASDTVEWGIKAGAISNDDPIDAALGTAVVITDTVITDGDLHVTSATPVLTVGGTPALGDLIQFEVYRNTDGTDDMAEDAWLIAVVIQYQKSNAIAGW